MENTLPNFIINSGPETPNSKKNNSWVGLAKKIQLLCKSFFSVKRNRYIVAAVADFLLIMIILSGPKPAVNLISPLVAPLQPLQPLTQTESKSGHTVFGFAPFWTFNNLDNVDFKVLTDFAYFGVELDGNGNLDREGQGYQTFKSKKATDIFKKAHRSGTRVILTVTQMKNDPILALMDDSQAQENAINQIVSEVTSRGIDGVNVDMEYTGDPGDAYRAKFTTFVINLKHRLNQEQPNSKVTVSVYASAVKDPKIYDIADLGQVVDGVFMMAYDFAVAGSDNAIPTAPLNGHKEGKYWYDVATAVDDFLKYMPREKLILGVPYYGYNYLVYEPKIKAETRASSWRGRPAAQTYSIAKENLTPSMDWADNYQEGWDPDGKVGYIAYRVKQTGTWRMVFLEDVRSLGMKYDFAKEKKLAGVGMWALGFDNGKSELWTLLKDKFGQKSVANLNTQERIND